MEYGHFKEESFSKRHIGLNEEDKRKLLIKLRLNFPELRFDEVEKKLYGEKYFRIKIQISYRKTFADC